MNTRKNFIGLLLTGVMSVSLATAIGITIYSKKPILAQASADATTYYSSADTSSASKLYSSLVSIESSGGTSSYANLWTIYKTAYLKSNGKIKDYYSDSTSFTPGDSQCGNYTAEGSCYNREHSIPKSWWGGAETNQGADPFIVVPTDGYVNNKRSNFPLGEVTSATYTSNSGCKLGTGTMGSYSGTVFEPMDSVKGDLARIVFYSRVRWPNVAMNSGDGANVFSGSQSNNYGLTANAVTMLTKWSAEDPVDDWEMSVNNAIYSNSTYGNRNPFIDHPEWVNTLWGGTTYDDSSSTTDSVSLSKTSLSLTVGNSSTLTATASGTVTWSTSNSSVATVSSGKVTAVAAGTATITATCGTATATCTVTVTTSGSDSGGSSSETTTGDIVFATASSDGSVALITSTITEQITSGSDNIASFSEVTKTYAGKSGLKIGSGDATGNITFTTSSTFQSKKVKSITVKGAQYGSDTGTLDLYVNGSSSSSLSVTPSSGSGTYTLSTAAAVSTIKVATSAKRAYLSSISFTFETDSGSSTTDSVSLDKSTLSLVAGNSSTLTATASGTVTWSTSNSSVATVSSGKVTAVAAGTATITATCGTATATCVVTVTASSSDTDVTVTNSIKPIYSMSASSSVTNVYGLYVGSVNNGASSIIMSGEYGIMLYKTAPDSSWVEGETYLCVTSSTLSIYKNLYELGSCTVTTVTDSATIAANVEPVVTYSITGSESSSDLTIANRLSTMTGTITAIGSSNTFTTSKDNTVTMSVNGHSISLFIKSSDATSDVNTAITNAYSNSTEITVQGFTSFYTNFQVMFKKVIEADTSYTAESFASDLLSLTDSICATSSSNNWSDVSASLAPIWVKLEGENYYAKLASTERTTLVNATANASGTTIEQAMNRYDHIVARYGFTNFITGRSVSSIVNPLANNDAQVSAIPLIVIISIVSVTVLGAVIILKKKEN